MKPYYQDDSVTLATDLVWCDGCGVHHAWKNWAGKSLCPVCADDGRKVRGDTNAAIGVVRRQSAQTVESAQAATERQHAQAMQQAWLEMRS